MSENGKGESPRERIQHKAQEVGQAMGGWLWTLAKENFKLTDQLSAVTEELTGLEAKVGEMEERLDALCKDLYGRTDAPQDPGPVPEPKAEEQVLPLQGTVQAPKVRVRDNGKIGRAMDTLKGQSVFVGRRDRAGKVVFLEAMVVESRSRVKFRGKVVPKSYATGEVLGYKHNVGGSKNIFLHDGRNLCEYAEQLAKEAEEEGNA